jgi:phosphoribosylglycinamide formyltransferase-1
MEALVRAAQALKTARSRSPWSWPTSPTPAAWSRRPRPGSRRWRRQKPFGKDREAHERAIDAALRERGIQVIALAGYMRILTPFLVDAWEGRMLNIHPSLLPAYPGLDTHGRALAAGEVEAGCTVHLVTAGVDEGPILGQARVPILPGDTEHMLSDRVLEQEHKLYAATLAEFVRGL